MCGRGGARHRPKPYIETGLLHKVLSKHEDLWVDMKGYELLSRNSAADPRALYKLLPLAGDLLDLEPSCEIHPQPLRACLTKMITEKPELNNSKFKGKEKPSKGSLKKDGGGSPLKKGEGAIVALKKETMPKKRKMAPSEVSVDSKGWPMELTTPKKMAASPPKLWKRGRVGHQSAKAEVASETGQLPWKRLPVPHPAPWKGEDLEKGQRLEKLQETMGQDHQDHCKQAWKVLSYWCPWARSEIEAHCCSEQEKKPSVHLYHWHDQRGFAQEAPHQGRSLGHEGWFALPIPLKKVFWYVSHPCPWKDVVFKVDWGRHKPLEAGCFDMPHSWKRIVYFMSFKWRASFWTAQPANTAGRHKRLFCCCWLFLLLSTCVFVGCQLLASAAEVAQTCCTHACTPHNTHTQQPTPHMRTNCSTETTACTPQATH